MPIPIDTDRITAQKTDDEFEALLDEMASILETEDDLIGDDEAFLEHDESFHDLTDTGADVDLGEEYFNLRDGPVVIGAPVVDPDLKDDAAIAESQEIQLVFDERPDDSSGHVVHYRMTPADDRDVLSLDYDEVDDEPEEESEPSLDRGTVRKRLGRLLSLFRE